MISVLISCLAGVASLCLVIYQSHHSSLPGYLQAPILALAFAAPILYGYFSFQLLRVSGYNKRLSSLAVISLLPIFLMESGWHWPLHIILVLSLVCLPLLSRKLLAPAIALTFPVLLIALVKNGYRIYGENTFYYPDPNPAEAWVRLDRLERPDTIVLQDGSRIPLHPFKIREDFNFEAGDAGLSFMSRTPLKETYFRRDPKAEHFPWEVREYNFYVCNLPHFFPSRSNGIMTTSLHDILFQTPPTLFEIADENAYKRHIESLYTPSPSD